MKRIEKTRLWISYITILTIIKNIFLLDITVIFSNPELYIIKDNGKIISFATIKKHKNYFELKTVFTSKNNRNKGFSSEIINKIIYDYPKIYLICKEDLKEYYKRFGFENSEDERLALGLKKKLYDLFIKPFSKKKLIIMKRS